MRNSEGRLLGLLRAGDNLPLVYRDIAARVLRADVFGPRSDKSIIVELLDNVCRPSTDTRHSEDGGKQIDVNPKRGVSGSRVEVYVGIKALLSIDELLNLARHVKPLSVAARTAEIF